MCQIHAFADTVGARLLSVEEENSPCDEHALGRTSVSSEKVSVPKHTMDVPELVGE